VVAYIVPNHTVQNSTNLFDKKLDISAKVLECLYGGAATMAALRNDVSISFESLSRSVALTIIEKDIKAALGAAVTWSTYRDLGLPAIELTYTEPTLVLHEVVAIQGRKLVGAVMFKPVRFSEVGALTKLAISKYL
jgi:hypothetical protein